MSASPDSKAFVLESVPQQELDEVVKDFESEGASVEVKKQPDGTWRVRAFFPGPEIKKAW